MYFIKRKSKNKKGFTWSVRFNYIDNYGRKKQYSKSGFETKLDAARFGEKKKIELELTDGIARNVDKTFNEVYEEYMEVEGQYKYSAATKQYYHYCFKNHVQNSKIGTAKIKHLHYMEMQQFFNSLENNGYATNKNIKKVCAVTFKHAMKCSYITQNPMPMITIRGKDTSKEKKILTYAQLNALIESLQETTQGRRGSFSAYSMIIFLYLGYFLGLRKSEILALEKSDVDFKNRLVNVDKRIVYHGVSTADIYATDRMKTKGSRSHIPMPDILCDVLEEWFDYNPYKIICCYDTGNYMNPYDVDFVLRKHAEKLGFEFHAHMLRHSYITNLALSGANLKVVSELARHASIQTTLDVYTQIDESNKVAAVDDVFNQNAFAKKSDKKVTNLLN